MVASNVWTGQLMSPHNTGAASPDLPAGPRSALIVAATIYQDPQLRQLRAPATDAVELAACLPTLQSARSK